MEGVSVLGAWSRLPVVLNNPGGAWQPRRGQCRQDSVSVAGCPRWRAADLREACLVLHVNPVPVFRDDTMFVACFLFLFLILLADEWTR